MLALRGLQLELRLHQQRHHPFSVHGVASSRARAERSPQRDGPGSVSDERRCADAPAALSSRENFHTRASSGKVGEEPQRAALLLEGSAPAFADATPGVGIRAGSTAA